MLKLLSFLRTGQRAEIRDARLIYQKTMKQSRKPAFYGPNLFADSYDGRMEVLCLHLSIVLHSLRRFGKNGEQLSQAIYDVMVDDFDVALREEGLSDTGVARRIKPLAKMFLSRAKVYADVLENEDGTLAKTIANFIALTHKKEGEKEGEKEEKTNKGNDKKISQYAERHHKELANASLGEIAQARFTFPKLD